MLVSSPYHTPSAPVSRLFGRHYTPPSCLAERMVWRRDTRRVNDERTEWTKDTRKRGWHEPRERGNRWNGSCHASIVHSLLTSVPSLTFGSRVARMTEVNDRRDEPTTWVTEGRGGDVVSWEVKEHYHKDNLRHLPRFPGFFVTFRILVTSLYSSPSRSAPCRLLRSGSAETRTEREKKRKIWEDFYFLAAFYSSTLSSSKKNPTVKCLYNIGILPGYIL